MTFPAALLGTTVRVLRTAAGRRALQLVLLVGGLFALGFLCGEQAHAADGAPVPARATSVRSVGAAGHGDVVRAVRTVTHRVATQAHTVGGQAVTPVREVLTTVSRTVDTVGTVEETAARAVVDTPRTSAPSLPLPDLPHGTDVPVDLTPEPESTGPRPQRSGGTAASVATERQKQRHTRVQGRTAVGAPARAAVFGPETAPVPRPAAHTVARHGAAALSVPGGPVPAGDSDGVLGKQAADGNASRHSDAHAVALDCRAPLRLVPGAAARVDAPRTRDRHRDIPVFPG
ncbi:hypothetical protein ACQPXS_28170 [Streptomyces sp. CA-142005]|uniref:hypothetical protein n=1 Tax=Streptomyces sp. CA-142005 TaxID=3240052 RepID=UPI003D927061